MATKGKKVASGSGTKRSIKGVDAGSSSQEDPNSLPLKFGEQAVMNYDTDRYKDQKNPSTMAMSTWRQINCAVNFPTFTPKLLHWDFNMFL